MSQGEYFEISVEKKVARKKLLFYFWLVIL